MRTIWLILILHFVNAGKAQTADTALHKTEVILSDVVIGANSEDNLQQSFYRQNKLTTTEDLLGRTEGVSLVRRGNYGIEPGLRVYRLSQTGLTINGMKIFGACTDGMDPATIYVEPNSLYRFQITQGAGGMKYGSAIGGSINLETKEPETQDKTSVGLTTSSTYASVNNGYTGNFLLSIATPKIGITAGAVYRKAFDYVAPHRMVVPYSGFEKSNYSLGSKFRLKSNQWLKAEYIGDLGWNIGYPALPMDAFKANANIGSLSYLNTNSYRYLKQVDIKLYGNYIQHEMGSNLRPDTIMPMDMPGMSYTIGTYTELHLTVKRHHIQIRADYYGNLSSASMRMYPVNAPEMFTLTLPDNLRQFAGLFIQDEWQIAEKHSLLFSMRNEYMRANLLTKAGKEQWSIFTNHSTASNQYLPSVAVKYTWQFVTNASFRITAAYGSSAPSANQLYGYYLFNAMDNYDYIGNPSLKNEKTFQTEVSLSYQRDILKFTTTGFYHRLFDYILGHIAKGYSPLTLGANGLKQYQNTPQAFVTGVEASVGINLKQGLQFLSTFTYSYGRMGNSEPIPMLSPLRGNIALRYGIKGWHIQAENDWATAKQKVNFLAGETPTPAFTLLNLRTGYKLVVKKHILTCNFSVENVLDTKYRIYSDWGNVPRPGRNFIVYLGYVFGM